MIYALFCFRLLYLYNCPKKLTNCFFGGKNRKITGLKPDVFIQESISFANKPFNIERVMTNVGNRALM